MHHVRHRWGVYYVGACIEFSNTGTLLDGVKTKVSVAYLLAYYHAYYVVRSTT